MKPRMKPSFHSGKFKAHDVQHVPKTGFTQFNFDSSLVGQDGIRIVSDLLLGEHEQLAHSRLNDRDSG